MTLALNLSQEVPDDTFIPNAWRPWGGEAASLPVALEGCPAPQQHATDQVASPTGPRAGTGPHSSLPQPQLCLQ